MTVGELRRLIGSILDVYSLVVLAWVVLSWIPVSPGHPISKLGHALGMLVEPVLQPIRRVIPPLGGAGAAIDFSPLILLVLIRLLQGLI
nr:MAG: YggT family protein [Actinomycetota bacterium]